MGKGFSPIIISTQHARTPRAPIESNRLDLNVSSHSFSPSRWSTSCKGCFNVRQPFIELPIIRFPYFSGDLFQFFGVFLGAFNSALFFLGRLELT